MSVAEIPGLEPDLETENAGTVEETAAENAVAGEATTPAATDDRISIDVLTREPVKTFLTDEDTGAIRTVQLDAEGRPVALSTGISQGAITATVLESGSADMVVERPLLRQTTNRLTDAPETDVVDPKTGEILEVVQGNDAFDLDAAVRRYIRKELLDTSA